MTRCSELGFSRGSFGIKGGKGFYIIVRYCMKIVWMVVCTDDIHIVRTT